MAASVWKCWMTAAVKVKRLSPSFTGKSHLNPGTVKGSSYFDATFNNLRRFCSFACRHLHIWTTTNIAVYFFKLRAREIGLVRWTNVFRASPNFLVSVAVFGRDLNRACLCVPPRSQKMVAVGGLRGHQSVGRTRERPPEPRWGIHCSSFTEQRNK